jgi:hypothetical protein
MQANKLQPYSHLLQAFYFGMANGVVSVREVVAWADTIIVNENEPDYFFIELSLCSDLNGMLQVISNTVSIDWDIISIRAVIGLVYHKYQAGILDNSKAINVLDAFSYGYSLSNYESSCIYDLVDDPDSYLEDFALVTERLLDFLIDYQCFNLNNYSEWPIINQAVEAIVAEHQAKWVAHQNEWNAKYQQERQSREQQAKLKRMLIRCLCYGAAIVFTFLLVLNGSDINNQSPLPKLEADVLQLAIIYMALFVSYHIVWCIKWITLKLFK